MNLYIALGAISGFVVSLLWNAFFFRGRASAEKSSVAMPVINGRYKFAGSHCGYSGRREIIVNDVCDGMIFYEICYSGTRSRLDVESFWRLYTPIEENAA